MERRWTIGGVAALGVVMAHSFAYLVVEPDPHQRLGLLEHTGHRWWTIAMAIAIGMGAVAIGSLIDHWRAEGGGAFDRTRVAVLLCAFQTVGFVILEGLERWFSGGDVVGVLLEPPVLVGIGMQVVVALLETLLLAAVAAGVARLANRAFPLPERAAVRVPYPFLDVAPPRPRIALGCLTTRGPPAAF